MASNKLGHGIKALMTWVPLGSILVQYTGSINTEKEIDRIKLNTDANNIHIEKNTSRNEENTALILKTLNAFYRFKGDVEYELKSLSNKVAYLDKDIKKQQELYNKEINQIKKSIKCLKQEKTIERPRDNNKYRIKPEKDYKEFRNFLSIVLEDSILESLNETQIISPVMLDNENKLFDQRATDAKVKHIIDSNNYLNTDLQEAKKRLEIIQLHKFNNADNSLINSNITDDEEITVAFAPIKLAVSAIFFYLAYDNKLNFKYNIKLKYSFEHGLDILTKTKENITDYSDVIVVSEGSALELMQQDKFKNEYIYIWDMPKGIQKIMTPKGNLKQDFRISDIPQGANFYFIETELSSARIQFATQVSEKISVKSTSLSNIESIDLITKGTHNSFFIAWDPIWQTLEHFNLVESNNPSANYKYISRIYTHRKKFPRQQQEKTAALKQLISIAWNALRNEQIRTRTIERMINDDQYVNVLLDCTQYEKVQNRLIGSRARHKQF